MHAFLQFHVSAVSGGVVEGCELGQSFSFHPDTRHSGWYLITLAKPCLHPDDVMDLSLGSVLRSWAIYLST